ncbi:MAG TPA: alpha/beta hydrolase-fold protein [Mycobacteriales bacterium]|nr:alpha/beta hydrolase-fold protein [Mycobacteriales bacterium]
MFAPTSTWLLVVLLALAVALVVIAIRIPRLVVRIPAALVAVVLPFVAGVGAVNSYFGYYRTWHDLAVGLGGTSEPGLAQHPVRATDGSATVVDDVVGRPGKVLQIDLPGPRSGINRSGYIYLPPEFNDKRFPTAELPVVELLHGSPGSPADWINGLHVGKVMDQLRAQHLIGPMVLVLVDINGGPSRAEECVDAVGGPQDDTYVSADVPADVRAKLGLRTAGRSWGLLGYSSGGYCAANLALRHRSSFHAAAALDGYFSPSHGGYAQRLFGGDLAAELANDPLHAVSVVQTSPLPAFFIAAGTSTNDDLNAARAFVSALGPAQHPQFLLERHARHNFLAWQASLPAALTWMWQQLATPILHRDYPQAAGNAQLPTELTLSQPPSPPPTPRPSPTPTHPGKSPTPSRPAPSATPSPTRRPTPTPRPSVSPSPSPRPTASSTGHPSPVPTPSPTRTVAPHKP